MEISCLLMLLPLPFNDWTLSVTVPFNSLDNIAITLTTVSYMNRFMMLTASGRHRHICVIISKAMLSNLLRHFRLIVEFRADKHLNRSQDRLVLRVPHTSSKLREPGLLLLSSIHLCSTKSLHKLSHDTSHMKQV